MSNSKSPAEKAKQAAAAKAAMDAKKTEGTPPTKTAEEIAAEKAAADKAAADKPAADKAAADKAAEDKKSKESESQLDADGFLNPFLNGVSYERFLKAKGKKSVEEYCKGKLDKSEINWLNLELAHYESNKKNN